MKQELQDKLNNDFPELYTGRNKPMTESLMCFGFAVGDGWYDLIYNLSNDITEYCKSNDVPIPEVVQVKEKFGGLRYYIDGYGDEEIAILIAQAEINSSTICEKCGKPGYGRVGGWVKVRCDECEALR